MSNLDAPHPVGSICPKHGLDSMNVYQGGQHRNYCCTVDDCDFQNYRYPCPDCENYEGGLDRESDRTTPCPPCAAARAMATSETVDMVNHPPHYTSHPSGVECIAITRHMGFNLGNALKYIWRADLKDKAIEDLEKAVFYLNDEIAKRRGDA